MSSFVEQWFNDGAWMTTADERILLVWGGVEWKETPDLSDSKPHFYFPDYFLTKARPWVSYEHNKTFGFQELNLIVR